MNKFKVILMVCICCFYTSSTVAGSLTTTISRISATTFTYGLIFSDTVPSNVPSCVGSYQNQLSWDKTTEHGKLMMTLLLSAYMAGKSVYVQYSDTECGLWGVHPLITRVDVLN